MTTISEALERLDADITAAQNRLSELQAMREGLTGFLKTYGLDVDESPRAMPPSEGEASGVGPAEAVSAYFADRPGVVLSIDTVHKGLLAEGLSFERMQVRNAIHYALRKGVLEKGTRRGEFVLTDASAPAATGAEEAETNSATHDEGDSSSGAEGGADETSALLRGRDDLAVGPQVDHGHAGSRASIAGVSA